MTQSDRFPTGSHRFPGTSRVTGSHRFPPLTGGTVPGTTRYGAAHHYSTGTTHPLLKVRASVDAEPSVRVAAIASHEHGCGARSHTRGHDLAVSPVGDILSPRECVSGVQNRRGCIQDEPNVAVVCSQEGQKSVPESTS